MKIAIVDCRMDAKTKKQLLLEGFYILETVPSEKLSAALASHPDMLMFKDCDTLITSGEYGEAASCFFEDLSRYKRGLHMQFTDDIPAEKYPFDALFNALVIGGKIFLKIDSASKAITDYAIRRGLKIINVKQGYPACTVLPLGENAAITADRGMARVMTENGIRVTLIDEGHISLPPYEYGFIGGAAGVFHDKVYFIGDYKTHPSYELIKRACLAEGLTPISLSAHPLCDLGRILFFEDNV